MGETCPRSSSRSLVYVGVTQAAGALCAEEGGRREASREAEGESSHVSPSAWPRNFQGGSRKEHSRGSVFAAAF